MVQETVTEIFRLTDRKSVFSAVFMTELQVSCLVAFRSVCCPVGNKALCETHCAKWFNIFYICMYTAPVILLSFIHIRLATCFDLNVIIFRAIKLYNNVNSFSATYCT